MENQGSIGDIFGGNRPVKGPRILSQEEFDALGLREIDPVQQAMAPMQEQMLSQLDTEGMLNQVAQNAAQQKYAASFSKPEVISPEEFQARGLREIEVPEGYGQQKYPTPFFVPQQSDFANLEDGRIYVVADNTDGKYKPVQWDSKAGRFYTSSEQYDETPTQGVDPWGRPTYSTIRTPKPRQFLDPKSIGAIAKIDSLPSQIGNSALRQVAPTVAGIAAFGPGMEATTAATAPFIGPAAPIVGVFGGAVSSLGAAALAQLGSDALLDKVMGDPGLQRDLNNLARPWVDPLVGTAGALAAFRPDVGTTARALGGDMKALGTLGKGGMRNVGISGANSIVTGHPEQLLDPAHLAKEFALGTLMQTPTKFGKVLTAPHHATAEYFQQRAFDGALGIRDLSNQQFTVSPELSQQLGQAEQATDIGSLFGDARSRRSAQQTVNPADITPGVNASPGNILPPVQTAREYVPDFARDGAPERLAGSLNGDFSRQSNVGEEVSPGKVDILPMGADEPAQTTDTDGSHATAIVNVESALPGAQTTQGLPFSSQLGIHSNIMGGVNSRRGITPRVIRFGHQIGLTVGAVNNNAIGYWKGDNGIERNPTTQFNIDLGKDDVKDGRIVDAVKRKLDAFTSAAGLAGGQRAATWITVMHGVTAKPESWNTGVQLFVGRDLDVHHVSAISEALSAHLKKKHGLADEPQIGVISTASGLRFIDFNPPGEKNPNGRPEYKTVDGKEITLSATDIAEGIGVAYESTVGKELGDAEASFFHFDSNYIDAHKQVKVLTPEGEKTNTLPYGTGYLQALTDAGATAEQLRGVDSAIRDANSVRRSLAGNGDSSNFSPGLQFGPDGLPYRPDLGQQRGTTPLAVDAHGRLSGPARPILNRDVEVPQLKDIGKGEPGPSKPRNVGEGAENVSPPGATPEQLSAARGGVDDIAGYRRPELGVDLRESDVIAAQTAAREYRPGVDSRENRELLARAQERADKVRPSATAGDVKTNTDRSGIYNRVVSVALPSVSSSRSASSARAAELLRDAQKYTGARLSFDVEVDGDEIHVHVVDSNGRVVARSTSNILDNGHLYGDRLDVIDEFQGFGLSKAVKAESIRRYSDALKQSGVDWGITEKPSLMMQDVSDGYRSTLANDWAMRPSGGMRKAWKDKSSMLDALRGDEVDDSYEPSKESDEGTRTPRETVQLPDGVYKPSNWDLLPAGERRQYIESWNNWTEAQRAEFRDVDAKAKIPDSRFDPTPEMPKDDGDSDPYSDMPVRERVMKVREIDKKIRQSGEELDNTKASLLKELKLKLRSEGVFPKDRRLSKADEDWSPQKKKKHAEIYGEYRTKYQEALNNHENNVLSLAKERRALDFDYASGEINPDVQYSPGEDLSSLSADQLTDKIDRLQSMMERYETLKADSPARFESMGGERMLTQFKEGLERLNAELEKKTGFDAEAHAREVAENKAKESGLEPTKDESWNPFREEADKKAAGFLGDDLNGLTPRQRELAALITKGTTVGKVLEHLSKGTGFNARFAKVLLAHANPEHLAKTVEGHTGDRVGDPSSHYSSPGRWMRSENFGSRRGAASRAGRVFISETHLFDRAEQETTVLHEVIHAHLTNLVNRAMYGRSEQFSLEGRDVTGSRGHKYLNRLRALVKDTSADADVRRLTQAYLRYLDSKGEAVKQLADLDLIGDNVKADEYLLHNLLHKSNSPYGMMNIHEFASEGLTNKEFRDELSKIKVGNDSLLGMVKGAISKMLGLKGKDVTLLDELAEASVALSAKKHADINRPGEQFESNLVDAHADSLLARRKAKTPETARIMAQDSVRKDRLNEYGMDLMGDSDIVARSEQDIRADIAQAERNPNPDAALHYENLAKLHAELKGATDDTSGYLEKAVRDLKDPEIPDVDTARRITAERLGIDEANVKPDQILQTLRRRSDIAFGATPSDAAIDKLVAERNSETRSQRRSRLDKELEQELQDLNPDDVDYDPNDDMGYDIDDNKSLGKDLRSGKFLEREVNDTRRRVQVAASVLRRGKMTPREAAVLGARTMADVVSIKVLSSAQAELDTLANRTGSKAARELSDVLNGGQAGRTDRAVKNGFHTDVSSNGMRFRNRFVNAVREFEAELKDLDMDGQRKWLEDLGRAVAKGKFDPEKGTWVGDDHPDPRINSAVQKIRGLYRELYLYQKRAGIELGNFGSTYLPRMLNNEAVLADRQGFVDAASKAYETTGMQPAEARDAAHQWWDAVLRGDSGFAHADGDIIFDSSNLNGEPKHTRERVFGPSGEAFMERFYNRNVMDATLSYINRAVRNAEMTRRFGSDFGKYRDIQQRFIDEGHGPKLREMNSNVAAQLGATTARDGGDASIVRLLNTYSAIHFLPRAAFSSLSEPSIMAVRTGRVRDMWNAYKDSAVQFVRQVGQMEPDYATKLSEDLGIVLAHLSDSSTSTSLDSRYFNDAANRGGTWLTSQFFRRTGLAQWTEGTRVATVKMGERFLHRLSEDVLQDGATKASSIRYLKELGVEDPVAFAKFVRNLNKSLPQKFAADARRQAIMSDTTKQNAAYRDALVRFAEQTIMNPNKGTRPRWANHPLGGVIFNLQSYLYAFHENVNKRVVRTMGTALDPRNELKVADRLRMAKPLALLGATVGIQYMLNELRQKVFTDPSRRFNEPDTPGMKFGKALSRANLIGRYDFIANAALGMKYDKEPATVMAGPVLGLMSELFKAGVDFYSPQNSKNTNTAERRMHRLAYDSLIQPSANAAFSAIPGGWLGGAVGAAGIQAASHPAVRESYVENMAGPPVDPKKRPPKRSVWDDMLPDIVEDNLK